MGEFVRFGSWGSWLCSAAFANHTSQNNCFHCYWLCTICVRLYPSIWISVSRYDVWSKLLNLNASACVWVLDHKFAIVHVLFVFMDVCVCVCACMGKCTCTFTGVCLCNVSAYPSRHVSATHQLHARCTCMYVLRQQHKCWFVDVITKSHSLKNNGAMSFVEGKKNRFASVLRLHGYLSNT